jgi:Leucine-rich repeat (LRR) protein
MLSFLYSIFKWNKVDKTTEIIENSTPDELDLLRQTIKKLDAYCVAHPEIVAEIMLKKYEVDYTDRGSLIYKDDDLVNYYDKDTDTYDTPGVFKLYLKYYKMKKLKINGSMRIKTIPILPNLEELYCRSTSLTSLPVLPNLLKLDCKFNKLSCLPVLPNLIELRCCRSGLNSLPVFPKLKVLWCEGNGLSSLPELPNLEFLMCTCDKVITLPALPKLKTFYSDNNELNAVFVKNTKRMNGRVMNPKRFFRTTHMQDTLIEKIRSRQNDLF